VEKEECIFDSMHHVLPHTSAKHTIQEEEAWELVLHLQLLHSFVHGLVVSHF
jgi:hypothetical protein